VGVLNGEELEPIERWWMLEAEVVLGCLKAIGLPDHL
jgi:hypothetical protein